MKGEYMARHCIKLSNETEICLETDTGEWWEHGRSFPAFHLPVTDVFAIYSLLLKNSDMIFEKYRNTPQAWARAQQSQTTSTYGEEKKLSEIVQEKYLSDSDGMPLDHPGGGGYTSSVSIDQGLRIPKVTINP